MLRRVVPVGDPKGRLVARRLVVLGLAASMVLAGCAPSSATPGPSPDPSPTATPTALPTPSPVPSTAPTAPAGTTFAAIPEAGVQLPVPDGWQRVGAKELADPIVRADLAATYPGARELLAALDELGGRAAPVFLAANPSEASLAGPVAANISVLVSQPSVGGFLLDVVAGFISDAIGDLLGAAQPAERERVQLAAGEAIRFTYGAASGEDRDVIALAWVIGAPSGTLLVTVMGTRAGLAGIDPDALAAAILPIPGAGG